MDKHLLERIGLAKSEIEVYISLLRLGSAHVSKISEDSGVHRTNIYTILNKLESMGLVSHFFEGGRKQFSATDPKNILNFLSENVELFQRLIPDLEKMRRKKIEEISIQLFKGDKATKAAISDLARQNGEVLTYGLSGQMRLYMPIFLKQIMREIRSRRYMTRCIYIGNVRPADFRRNFEVRYLPKSYFSPVYTWIYGDKVLIVIWSPSISAIMIKFKEVADSYRKYFELLWSIAKKGKPMKYKEYIK